MPRQVSSCRIGFGPLHRSCGKLRMNTTQTRIVRACVREWLIFGPRVYIDAPILRAGLVLTDLPGESSFNC
jgi:hypothetical protein